MTIRRVQLVAPNCIDPDHLIDVRDEMRAIGAPTVRVLAVSGGPMDTILSIEGSHRIAAALSLGMTIHHRWINPNAVVTDHDVRGFDGEVMGPMRAGDLAAHILGHCNYVVYILNPIIGSSTANELPSGSPSGRSTTYRRPRV